MNLLVTGAWADAKAHFSELEAMGHTVNFLQFEKDNLPCEYAWVEGIICNGLFLSHPIERFTNLRYIQLTSAGFDRVDMDYVQAHEIEIRNARGVYSIPMAEFALCGVLQLYKQAAFFRENQKRHIWEKHRGLQELSGKRVLIVGCGSVGSECAKRFAAFGCEVIGVDLFPREDSLYSEILPLSQLDNALSTADVIVLTLPLTEQTKHLMNEERFSLLKSTAVLVNIARGAIIDTEALLNHIDNLGGAVLDVFEDEPLSEDSPLWDKQNIILTPHNSFVGDGNGERIIEIIYHNLSK
ncbi:MAG: hydroxyacid dehydrogenase [Ruminococcus sp.]|uniref:NAD(P)-dependent oxidoreductase n=1 Tax=Ruminococcus sp. TaxID=41978 RepID=UPI0028738C17|nr:NAD(P)-dependent oxidoreductase [Ruminococcus sp.]MBQ3285225.1 hydroxyacid dehydrogenase [Ruminococcus sp.]